MTRQEEVRKLLKMSRRQMVQKAGKHLVIVEDIDVLHQHFADTVADEIKTNNAHGRATKLILRCDGGGSNSSRSWLMKQDFQDLATRIGLPVQIQHYPPYCSKYNRLEHRLFPHMTRQWDGVIFQDYAMVQTLTEQTTTKTGLTVKATIHEKTYLTGRQADADKIENLNIDCRMNWTEQHRTMSAAPFRLLT